MNTEQTENREIVVKSLKHWMGMPSALAGYSFTGAASISAMLGDGDAALKYLHKLISWNRIGFNTLYMEAGPCIETPLAAAASVHDMLLSSWGNKIRVFPGLPETWQDVTIHNMRTEGAFLVSAVRRGGVTQFVRVTSLAGEPCRIRTDMGKIQTDSPVPFKTLGDGTVELGLKKGETALLYPAGAKPDFVIAPVSPTTTRK
jgi:alpha-L-fucosidase 2